MVVWIVSLVVVWQLVAEHIEKIGRKASIEGVLAPRQPHRGVSTPPAAVRMRNDGAMASRTIFSTS
jgi:hypothetical protein